MVGRTLRPDTLDLILELTRAAPESQLRDAESLDAKTIQVFAAASVIVGLASVGVSGGEWPTTLFFLFGLIAYVLCAYASTSALMVRDFRKSFHADNLWPEYWYSSPEEIKHALVDDISAAYKHNKEQINSKAESCTQAIWAMAGESILIGVGAILARIL